MTDPKIPTVTERCTTAEASTLLRPIVRNIAAEETADRLRADILKLREELAALPLQHGALVRRELEDLTRCMLEELERRLNLESAPNT